MPIDLYDFDLMPKSQKIYLMRNGWHFTKELFEDAATMMYRKNKQTGKEEPVPVFTKEEVEAILRKHNIEVKNKGNYDFVFAAQMCRADYLGSSVPDELHLAMFVRDLCDDVDAADGTILKVWVTKMNANGEPIDWVDYL